MAVVEGTLHQEFTAIFGRIATSEIFLSALCNLPEINEYFIGKGETNSMKGTYIGEFEELVLLTVGILYHDAYGLAILDELEHQTGRTVLISSVHKALVRLEDKGYLKSRMGGATQERGGRDKRLYSLTQAGVKVVNESRELRNTMWKQAPRLLWEGKL